MAVQEEEDRTTNRGAHLLIIEKASATSVPAVNPPWIEATEKERPGFGVGDHRKPAMEESKTPGICIERRSSK
jgi:hypothetical protein